MLESKTKIVKDVVMVTAGQKILCLVIGFLFIILTLIFQNKKPSADKICVTGAMIPLMYLFYNDWDGTENVFDNFTKKTEEDTSKDETK